MFEIPSPERMFELIRYMEQDVANLKSACLVIGVAAIFLVIWTFIQHKQIQKLKEERI